MRLRRIIAGLLLLAGCSLTSVGQKALERRARGWGYTRHELDRQGQHLAWWSGGSGPPVILLHGFGGDGLGTWQAQFRSFAAVHRVIVPDLLWFGSSRADVAPSLSAQVAAVRAILAEEATPRADVVGMSYGGFVAMKLLDECPEVVDRLVIVDSPGPLFTAQDEAAMVARFGAASTEDLFLPDTPEDVRTLLDLTWYEPLKLPGFVLEDLLLHVFTANREQQRGLLRDLQAQRGVVGLPDLAGHPAPLVVWGRHDEVFPEEMGRRLATALGGRFEAIDRTAHGPPVERPEVFNRIVLDYLRPGPPAPPAPAPAGGAG